MVESGREACEIPWLVLLLENDVFSLCMNWATMNQVDKHYVSVLKYLCSKEQAQGQTWLPFQLYPTFTVDVCISV